MRIEIISGSPRVNSVTRRVAINLKNWLDSGEWNHDTIGMVAMDMYGNLSGSCTTSGAGFKMRGRLGDSPIIGAGLFVDNEIGACTATGQGEDVIRVAGSHSVVELMRQGLSPEAACKKSDRANCKDQEGKGQGHTSGVSCFK